MGLEVFTGKIADLVVTNPLGSDVRSQGDDHIRGIKLTIKNDCVSKSDNQVSPVGSVTMFAGSSIPAGWIWCNGQLLSRATYAALFATIGTLYGAGDGSTTFAIPDLRGQFVRGLDAGRGVDVGRALGSNQGGSNLDHTHSGTTNAGSAHSHGGYTTANGSHTHAGTALVGFSGGNNAGLQVANGQSQESPTTRVGTMPAGDHAHFVQTDPESGHTHAFTTSSSGTESRPVNVAMNYIIKF